MVRAAGRCGIGQPNCLKVSLAFWWLLARQGIASDLRVGVRKDGAKFEAHAWVECVGVALHDPGTKHPHYAAFDAALASLPLEPR
jgi:Transglutaminase-like superfamily